MHLKRSLVMLATLTILQTLLHGVRQPKVQVVGKETEKIEERLAKAIVEECEKMQAAVIQSIIGFLGKSNSNIVIEEDITGGGQSNGQNGGAATSTSPQLSPNAKQSPNPGTQCWILA
ncbi:hypothetical protein Rs2_40567 [Raphanus sativus]|nr:hypothetical protein Rs2_40567 [Raphanus sativus]